MRPRGSGHTARSVFRMRRRSVYTVVRLFDCFFCEEKEMFNDLSKIRITVCFSENFILKKIFL